MGVMESEAPNFRGTYPLAGEKIGPAWREIWRQLSDVEWIEGDPFSARLASRTGLAKSTVSNLLWKASLAGILVKKIKYERSRKRAYYRVAKRI